MKSLDEAQKLAVEVEGPALLIAGPGTGKTTTLLSRIEHLIEKGVSPSAILGLTFSEAAAGELRKRVAENLHIEEDDLRIFTFHGFAKWLADCYPDKFQLPENFMVVNEVDRFQIIREALENLTINYLTTKSSRDRNYYVKDLIHNISTLKKEAITKEAYFAEVLKLEQEVEEAGEPQTATKAKELDSIRQRAGKLKEQWEVFEYYQARLAEMHAIDFEDMLGGALHILETDLEFRKTVAQDFQFVLVDEYQDTNQAQNKMLFLVTKHSGNSNVLVVGDDDQSVYGFQGASMRNVRDFLEHFPEAQVITLTSNFRSSQKILDLAEKIISEASDRLADLPELKERGVNKKLKAENPAYKDNPAIPQFIEFNSRAEELSYAVETIKHLHNTRNVPYSEIAVLARTNREGKEISKCLFDNEIPHAIGWSEDIMKNPVVVRLHAVLSALFNAGDAESFFIFMNLPVFKGSLIDAVKVASHAKRENLPMVIALDRLLAAKYSFDSSLAIQEMRLTFANLQNKLSGMDEVDFIKEVVKELKLFKGLGEDREISRQSLLTFIDQFKDFNKRPSRNSLQDFIKHLDLAEMYQVAILSEKQKVRKDSVSVLTAHSAKGTEFQYVIVTGVSSKAWENRTPPAPKIALPQELLTGKHTITLNQFNEEARLLYVAVTRAKMSATLTYAVNENGNMNMPSGLILALKDSKALEFTRKSMPLATRFAPGIFKEKSSSRQLKTLVKATRLSASSLRLFRQNRQLFKYIYLYKLPEKETSIPLVFGSCLHEALHTFMLESTKARKWLQLQRLMECFEEKWALYTDYFPNNDFVAKQQEASDMLSATYEALATGSLVAEENLGLEDWAEARIDDIVITGKVDYYEITPEGIKVTDYKSGQPESENAIMGNIKSSDGATYDQLLFYKLLLESKHHKDVIEGTIFYLKDPKKKRTFDLRNASTDKLTQKIKEAYILMENGNFEPVSATGEVQYTDQFYKLSKLGL